MKYIILILTILFASCNDSKNVNNFLQEEKIINSEIQNDGTHEEELVSKIQLALKERGYEIEVTGKMDMETKKAIMKFQKDNDIPWQYPKGILLTLKALGIED